ncbi:MAG: hypothetical protein ABIA75_05760 [Candidatus Neomarinimicrobiota bacterium]
MNFQRSAFCLLFLLTSILIAREQDARQPVISGKTAVASTGYFDGNRIKTDLENNGMIVSHRISGHSGLEWPKDNRTYAIYASGLWYAGKVNGEVRTACVQYSAERVPGSYGTNPEDPRHKLYKIDRKDLFDPLTNADFQNWPTDLGAPWVDVNGNGIYEPLPVGPDHPEFIGDQVIWYVSNDGDSSSHTILKTAPMGLEFQTTIFGLNRPNITGDIIYIKELIINKGSNTIEDMYIGIWSDPDLGNASDDYVGCDTTLGMGICYNDGADDDYAGFVGGTPALGFDFFQGPIVPSDGDTAFTFGKFIYEYKNLGMTSFRMPLKWGFNTTIGDPTTSAMYVHNALAGLNNSGTEIDFKYSGGSRYMLPGDPTKNIGSDDIEVVFGDFWRAHDVRLLMGSGPFIMAPGDSQEVVFAIILAAAGDALDSYLYLKQVDLAAQNWYDNDFRLPPAPPAPQVTVSALPESIILTWDDAAEDYVAKDAINFNPSGESTEFVFEGYNVYQLETLSGSGAVKRIATFDLINGVEEIYDDVFDSDLGEVINRRVQFGRDSGIRRYLAIDQDALNNNAPLKINRAYYFAVTAYGYNPCGVPKTLESPLHIITARPQLPSTWNPPDSAVVHGNFLTVDHIAGISDGGVRVRIIDPTQLTGHTYEVSFSDTGLVTTWAITDVTLGIEISGGNTLQDGIDQSTGIEMGKDAGPIVDGFQVAVQGPSNGIHGVWQVSNADGPIAGIDTDVNENILWINFLTAPDYPTEQAQGGWFFFGHAGGVPNEMTNEYSTGFLDRVFRGDNFSRAMPYDFEMRFTADALANGKGYLRFGDGVTIISVPFELWNIGTTPDDPSDDYRMLPAVYKDPGPDPMAWGFGGDAAHSGSANDPYSDWIYWGNPSYNMSPGQAGYDAFFANGIGGVVDNDDFVEVIARTLLMNWNGYVSHVNSMALTSLSSSDPAAWTATDTAIFLSAGWFIDTTNDLGIVEVTGNYATGRILGIPEVGTVYRMITNKPNGPDDLFAFTTASVSGDSVRYRPQLIKVWPNPYYNYNPEQSSLADRQVHFTNLPTVAAVLSVFLTWVEHRSAGLIIPTPAPNSRSGIYVIITA